MKKAYRYKTSRFSSRELTVEAKLTGVNEHLVRLGQDY